MDCTPFQRGEKVEFMIDRQNNNEGRSKNLKPAFNMNVDFCQTRFK